MTPAAMAMSECANAKPPRGCLRSRKGCLLIEDARCAYFEESVLPLAVKHPDKWPGVAEAYREGQKQATDPPGRARIAQGEHKGST